MGLFSTIELNCYHCHRQTWAQTKISDEECSSLRIGDHFSHKIEHGILWLKDTCQNCQESNAILIRNYKIVEVVDPQRSDLKEGAWGSTEVLKSKVDDVASSYYCLKGTCAKNNCHHCYPQSGCQLHQGCEDYD